MINEQDLIEKWDKYFSENKWEIKQSFNEIHEEIEQVYGSTDCGILEETDDKIIALFKTIFIDLFKDEISFKLMREKHLERRKKKTKILMIGDD